MVFVMPVAYMPNIESAYGSLACVCAVFELTCTSSKTGMTMTMACMLVFTHLLTSNNGRVVFSEFIAVHWLCV
jgi:hypothetical protein